MTTAVNIDPAFLARELELPVGQVQDTLQLLDDGNTIPFITRYRKERTGGLNEEQILRIQQEALKLRLLAERKQTILRSIESQGILTQELAAKINAARTLKWLEDVYLPYKPKKQTLATIARHRGLEPLAKEILDANPTAQDLQARGSSFLAPDRGLNTVEDVLQGVGHILAEMFSERADIRGRLRKALRRDGVLTCARIDPAERSPSPAAPAAPTDPAPDPVGEASERPASATTSGESTSTEVSVSAAIAATDPPAEISTETTVESSTSASTEPPSASTEPPSASTEPPSASTEPPVELPNTADAGGSASVTAADCIAPEGGSDGHAADNAGAVASEQTPAADQAHELNQEPKPRGPLASQMSAKKAPTRKQLAKERKKKLLEHAFKDYYNFREGLSRLPPHRILAINRGERAKVLRVRVDYDGAALIDEAAQHMVPDGHVHGEYLRQCARDALQRLVLPSLERELRRELAEEAEQHALQVFIRNLRKLLLQPPVRGKRVLAVDPGFRSGCKLAAIDAFGNVLEHGMIHLVGSDEQRTQARATLASIIRRHQLELVAIGNGAGCRAAEHIVSDVIGSEFGGTSVAYLIVNEAGASVYSTSQVGRDELPQCDPMMRSAVSIARRLQDPLSELVKINPANIGVGMYQHDMKGKHLRESLDSVVKLCVNFVGVELNSASPSLLGYVSGLNQLTARRVYEYRQKNGPFRNREQIKDVPGIGEATYVQAAGFLRISDGDNPLDATWIHPESYDAARRVLERLNIPLTELAPRSATESRPAVESANASPITPPTVEPTVTDPGVIAESPGEQSIESPAPYDQTSTDSASADSAAGATATVEPTTTQSTACEPPAREGIPVETSAAESNAAESNAANSSESPQAEIASPVTAGPSFVERLSMVAVADMSRELGIGELLLEDILAALAKPGRDPRDDFSPPPFRTGIMKLDDLKPGMELQGTVLNVVDFGAFVDIGISDSALIHISKLADQFIRDPQEVVGVGDFLKVWVIDVDKVRRRVSLTAIDPAAERRPRERREGRPNRSKPQRQPAGNAPTGGAPPAPKSSPPPQRQQQRPPRPAGKNIPPKSGSRTSAPPPKPKPVRPITPAMLNGQQPMRSFSDLMQFYTKKQQDSDEKK